MPTRRAFARPGLLLALAIADCSAVDLQQLAGPCRTAGTRAGRE